jgi:hypothetical protein
MERTSKLFCERETECSLADTARSDQEQIIQIVFFQCGTDEFLGSFLPDDFVEIIDHVEL